MRISVLLILAVLTACTSNGPVYSGIKPDKDKATIVVYRIPHWVGSGGYYPVDINGREECNLSYKAFFVRQYQPQEINVTASLALAPGTSRISVKGEKGRIYYFRIEQDQGKNTGAIMGGLVGGLVAEGVSNNQGPFVFTLMPEDGAKRELATLNQDCQ